MAATHPLEGPVCPHIEGLIHGAVLALAGIGSAAAQGLQAGTQVGHIWVVVAQEEVVGGVVPREAVHHQHCQVTV